MSFESSIDINAPAESINNKTKVTIGGDVSGSLAWLARRGGQAASAEIALALKTRIDGSA